MKLLGIPIRLADTSHGNLNYLVNLAVCLARFGARWQPVVLSARALMPAESLALLEKYGVRLEESPGFAERPTGASFLRGLLTEDPKVRHARDGAGLACLFENAAIYGWNCGLPVLHWIPDLQHRVLPAMFPWVARMRRELLIRCALASNRSILVSSADARAAMMRYYAADARRLHIARFASMLVAEARKANVPPLPGIPGLAGPYAFIPNQFWKHKNHSILPHAAKRLSAKGQSLTFVCTGEHGDPRNTKYFAEFDRLLDECGVRDRFLMPGLVSYSTVRHLHRHCTMLINPSLVEGWNTGVEEAKYFGSRLVLSDIGIHREQTTGYPVVRYFNPGSPEALAAAIGDTLAEGSVGSEEQAAASHRYEADVRCYVDAVESALDRCTEHYKTVSH